MRAVRAAPGPGREGCMHECARLSACCGRGVAATGVGWLRYCNVPKESNKRSTVLVYRFSERCAFPSTQYTLGVIFFTDKTLSVSFLGVRDARGHLKVQSVMEPRTKDAHGPLDIDNDADPGCPCLRVYFHSK